MSFLFTHDGVTYQVHTEVGGERPTRVVIAEIDGHASESMEPETDE